MVLLNSLFIILMKFIPNLFTLANLLFGCLAIIFTLQNGFVFIPDENSLSGFKLELASEAVFYAGIFIGLAALVDFFDGFLARLLKADGEMGAQLDSLADVVSFGVAPAMIVFQFLRLSFAQSEDGLTVPMILCTPAFLIPCAAAWRLARFNIDKSTPSHYFRGVPVPAVGVCIGSLPFIWWNASQNWEIQLLTSYWFYYIIIICVSLLMISNIPVMSNKPHGKGYMKFLPHSLVAIFGISAALLLGWWAVPITFTSFVAFSLIFKKQITQ